MCFSTKLWVCEEVDQCSLFNKLVFFVDSVVFKLFFGVSQMLILDHFATISPLICELGVFISWVDIVENWELWTNEISEMSYLNITKEKSNKEFMMPDHSSQPIVMFPSSKSWDGVNGSNIQTNENETSSWSSQSFVMWWNLFWSNCLEQCSHEIKMRHIDWRSLSMIWMNVSDLHLFKSVSIVIVGAVLSLILWLDAKNKK